jgi:hypothetical protein
LRTQAAIDEVPLTDDTQVRAAVLIAGELACVVYYDAQGRECSRRRGP